MKKIITLVIELLF